MNYTNSTINQVTIEHIDLPLIFLSIFGISIIIFILSIIFPNATIKICSYKKNKVSTTTDMKYNDPIYHYSEIYFDNLNEICPICHEEILKGDNIYVTDCKHYYHKQCITKWFNNNYNCPICRKFIYDVYDVNLI